MTGLADSPLLHSLCCTGAHHIHLAGMRCTGPGQAHSTFQPTDLALGGQSKSAKAEVVLLLPWSPGGWPREQREKVVGP